MLYKNVILKKIFKRKLSIEFYLSHRFYEQIHMLQTGGVRKKIKIRGGQYTDYENFRQKTKRKLYFYNCCFFVSLAA